MDGLLSDFVATAIDQAAAILSSWTAHTQPGAVEGLVYDTLPQVLTGFALCYALDAAITSLPLAKSRWFTLHATINAAVVALAAEDTYATLADPVHATTGPASTLGVSLIIALHLYHAVYFKLSAVDIIHHVVSVGILGPLAVCYRPGVFLNYVGFFVSGLPGGIDYAMLSLVKHGYMDSMTEKFWNTKINVWMRGPMCVVGAFIAYQSALESSFAAACAGDQCAAAAAGARMPAGQRAASLTTAVILLWNGQFFAERVIVNYGERSKQSTAEMYAGAAAGMLPRNLSKPSLKAMARNLSRDSLLQLAEASN